MLLQKEHRPPHPTPIQARFAGRRVIVYGAGECSHWFFEIAMRMHGITPILVLDRACRPGDSIEGIPMLHPQEFHPAPSEIEEASVVICVGNQAALPEIRTDLQNMGFRDIISLMELYEIHNPFDLPLELREQGFEFYRKSKERILAAFDLMADDPSRELYALSIANHLTRTPTPLPFRPREEQYFPRDIPLSKGYARFVNCGAYDGDVIRLLHQVHGSVEEIVCFEPEPAVFERLGRYLQAASSTIAERVTVFPCAVYDRNALMPFISGHGLGSRLSEAGNTRIQTLTLDSALPSFEPTFICMDIEGAEPQAIRGAAQMISRHTPDLAICVYHSPNHLWEIPILLHNMNPDYKLYLRNYTGFTAETVLYATR